MQDDATSRATPQIGKTVLLAENILLADRLTIEDDAVIEHGVIFAPTTQVATIVRAYAHIGAGAVIGAGIEIGRGAHVLPGTVVLSSIPANAVARGNPAQIVGYTTDVRRENSPVGAPRALEALQGNRRKVEIKPLNVGGAAIYKMPKVLDIRGSLTVGEMENDLPFPPKRYFIVFDVPSEKLRGEHAHRTCHQFLICLSGSCTALLDDGGNRHEVVLDSPDTGLYMPPMIWGTQYRYTRNAVLLVFASHAYDNADYIRDYETFRAELDCTR